MDPLVWFSKIDESGIILVCNPPVNALNPGVVDGIRQSIREAEQDASIKAIILSSNGRTFIAGTDIDEFRRPDSGRKRYENLLHPLLSAIEECRKPILCAINGAALGGGLEIALACHYRVAAWSAQVGQPEVKLGLIPAGGGTQRLPRLAGVATAARLCSEGNSITAGEALRLGILDGVVDGALLPGALSFARNLIAMGSPSRKTRDRMEKLTDPAAGTAALEAAREKARRRYRGQIAPLKAIDAVEAATKLSFEEGCSRESEIFNECLFSDQSKALIHVAFAEQELARIYSAGKSGAHIEVRKAAIVGAGNMGTGIAMVYANAGIPVLLKDASQELLDKGIAKIREVYERALSKESINHETARRRLDLITPVLNNAALSEADVIVEAVFEDLQLKRQVFSEVAEACRPDAILATNTSLLDIDQIASSVPDPSRVLGHHFFAPANVMPLIEIVRGSATSDEVIASSIALAERLRKTAVVVGNCPGFAGNRMYYPYQREAQFLVEEGADVQDVDAALYEFGMAMGPFATRDLSGLDVGWRAQKEYAALEPTEMRCPLVLDHLYRLGRYGQKTGAGWYRYQPGSREPIPDPDVRTIITQCAEKAGIRRRSITPAEILERTLYAMINEGARILEDGIVRQAVALDVIFITGYGFPAYRGGPMYFADHIGLRPLCDRLREFEKRYGTYWAPAPLLIQLAEKGESLADFGLN